ncbi:MAG: hypothetical protein ABJF95_03570, partial [Marinobacter sp.]|uniref:hypothetical protein n=1 Tax=Marinobacter sp. TaxID=50741 RepID=UPI0032658DD8
FLGLVMPHRDCRFWPDNDIGPEMLYGKRLIALKRDLPVVPIPFLVLLEVSLQEGDINWVCGWLRPLAIQQLQAGEG